MKQSDELNHQKIILSIYEIKKALNNKMMLYAIKLNYEEGF